MKLKIKVQPNSKKQGIKKLNKKEYEIKIKSEAENNKANIELIKLLSKYFKAKIKIKSGLKSKNKVVEINEI